MSGRLGSGGSRVNSGAGHVWAFVKAHQGTELGSALDVLREQRRLHEARRRSEWEAGLDGYAS